MSATENNALEPIINATALVITDNFEQLKIDLVEQIKLYEIEVTEENLTDARKMATELNKLSTTINKIKIDKSKEFAAPIEEFKKKAAELIDIVQSGRMKILKQIEIFDQKIINIVTSLLAQERANLYVAMSVKPEFQTARIESLILKSSLTAGGQLTKTAKDKLAEMVASDHAMQETVESRVASLQSIAERAGLINLSESLVTSFIREPEAIYAEKLNKVIDGEIKRQKELEEKIRAQEAERLAKQSSEAQKSISAAMPAKPVIQPKEPTEPTEPTEPQKTYRVEFMGAVSDGQTSDCIVEWLEALSPGEFIKITKE